MIIENDFPYYFNGYLNNKNPVIIGGKIPDFVHNREKKVIEINGDYFHKGENSQDRIDYFKQFGYDCLVIWASELRNKSKVVEKISFF